MRSVYSTSEQAILNITLSHNLEKQRQVFLLGLHGRESKHLSDTVVISEEHDHAINTHAEPSGRGQAVLERLAESLVDHLRLVVTLVLLPGLLLEPQPLLECYVQLGVTIGGDRLRSTNIQTSESHGLEEQ